MEPPGGARHRWENRRSNGRKHMSQCGQRASFNRDRDLARELWLLFLYPQMPFVPIRTDSIRGIRVPEICEICGWLSRESPIDDLRPLASISLRQSFVCVAVS